MATHDKYSDKKLKALGQRLKELRIAKGYKNYEQFAYDNRIPRAQYGRYENGQDLRFSSLCKVLKALDISFEEFFRGFN
ncbi:helix-turn-helix transcriptional regulator [uncultured Lacinutrix sp.]|uniref:helix-turn-helix domain-containing protein n=1 Tax=uncultured Lacinutrix sp. TaxID=574032 RepID=UPI00262DE71D|nr:helix-turn-helix transcriptional regulator [uncultured Lacinutrix sp.]